MREGRSSTPPVFVDPTGWRRKAVRVTAVGGAIALLGVVAVLVAALLGAPIGPSASLPDETPGPVVEGVPLPVPPAAVAHPTTTPTPTSARTGDRPNSPGVTTTTVPPAGPPAPSTTDAKGNSSRTPPGRPTDLPAPPGHTR